MTSDPRPTAQPPTGLLCELVSLPVTPPLQTAWPRYGWVVNDQADGAFQSAYRILVASDPARLAAEQGDVWDSGKIASRDSIDIRHAGHPLEANRIYAWTVRTWNERGEASPWATPQRLRTGERCEPPATPRCELRQTELGPAEVARKDDGSTFVDFGKAAFGTVRLKLTSDRDGWEVDVHLGECLSGPRTVDRTPPGTIRYRCVRLALRRGTHLYTLVIPPDARNTGEAAIRMPPEIGEVLPFRYGEIVNSPSPVGPSDVRQVMVHYPFDDDASRFASASPVLDRVWALCKHTIKATTFCGVYVDGDRERIPYEADAYINQLCHYSVDREFTLARFSHEYLIGHPTWPTEWILHSVLMAWADYLYTGNADSLARHYDDLSAKTLLALAREDGLISSEPGRLSAEVLRSIHIGQPIRDIVDWPPASFSEGRYGERDGYEMVAVNTVVNAFHWRALALMARIAAALGRGVDATHFERRAARVRDAIHARLFDASRGVYVDGEGSRHAALHANLFPLAFGLTPAPRVPAVAAHVKSRGMACSVYGAQFLLEAMYRAGEDTYALALMTAEHDRSWHNMIRAGSTMTLEAWDWKYKQNLDWNHAWGAAPANIIPRFLMGIRPLEPGFGRMRIEPQPGALARASIRLPTIRGAVAARFEQVPGRSFALEVEVPVNTSARVSLPCGGHDGAGVTQDGKAVEGRIENGRVILDPIRAGRHAFVRRLG